MPEDLDHFNVLQNQLISTQNELDIAQQKLELRFDELRKKISKSIQIQQLAIQGKKQLQLMFQLPELKVNSEFVNQIFRNGVHAP
jgi:hypothetical protein